jgi:hypothetical protein
MTHVTWVSDSWNPQPRADWDFKGLTNRAQASGAAQAAAVAECAAISRNNQKVSDVGNFVKHNFCKVA